MKQCSINGCERTDIKGDNGWCRLHYHRWYRTGDPGEGQRRHRASRGTCTIDGCDKTDQGKSRLCNMHATRLKRHGDVHTVVSSIDRNLPTGPDHTNWAYNQVGYTAAHHRVHRRRGSASQHHCQHCHTQAQHWAYTHDCPDELTTFAGYPYSPHPDRYIPLCVPCHKRYDLGFLDSQSDQPALAL